jgi:transcriptional regulator with XRE-family HTH domain
MNFDQKLTTLMNLFKISNSKLARNINIDASLVSRWKSGERKISINSPHIPMLANYFLHVNAYHYQKEYLDKIIAARLPEKERLDDASRVHVLADWLVSGEPPESQPDEQPEQLAKSSSLIANIAGLLTGSISPQEQLASAGLADMQSELSDLPAGTDWQPAIIPGKTSTYEVFSGRSGKRQAVLNLFYQVLQSESKLEIMLTSEDDTRWLMEDHNFTLMWYRLLMQVLEKGHQITLIHVLNRKTSEIMSMLNYWMPLHIAGSMHSYYYPRYGERRIRQTLFIIRHQAAVVSNTTVDYSGIESSFLFRDPSVIDQYTRLFMVHLSQCRPLFAVYSRYNMRSFFDQSLEYIKKTGSTFSIRHNLNIRLLPLSILNPYLIKSHGQDGSHRLSELMDSQRQVFFSKLDQDSFTDILPLALLDQISHQRFSFLPSCDIFTDKPVQISPADTLLWLRQIVDTLRRSNHYELFLYTEPPTMDDLQVKITYKENTMVLFSPEGREKRKALAIILNEANTLNSMSYYFDEFIQRIPTSLRNKADVIQRLEKMIAGLLTQKG